LKNILKELRIKQYTKNFLVFAAALFAGKLLVADIIFLNVLAFFAFSFTASIVYIINDIMDVEKDRQHPDKCKRPLASGEISIPFAIGMGVSLFIVVVLMISKLNSHFGIILGIYLMMNLLYSWKLKHVVIVDVMIIAFGFVLRALAGVIATGVGTTSWFILCVFMLSLFLALAKRRHELELFAEDQGRQRKVLQFYSLSLIDQLLTIVTAMAITSYSIFASQADTLSIGGISFMSLTIPMVVYGMFRYLYLVHIKKIGGKPEDILLCDKHILGVVVLYTATIIFIRNIY